MTAHARQETCTQAPPLLAEATELHNVLTDGAPPAGYHVRRGFSVRDARTKQPVRSSFTDTWLPARDRHADDSETDRLLNPYVLLQHLRGRYDVAWTAPSWSSLVVLDIDRPALPDDADLDALLAANWQRDEVLAAVWRAFDFHAERQPVCLSTPGGGYHLYLPFCRSRDPAARERTWPNQWAREWIEHVLHRAGLALRPGRLELYPSGVRLRAPCGRGMALLVPENPTDPDELQLQPVHARSVDVIDGRTGRRSQTLRRDLAATVRGFLSAIEAARRPLEEWVAGDDAPPAWSRTWGPFGDRATVAELAAAKKREVGPQGAAPLFQHKEEVEKAPGASGPQPGANGMLLRGRAFYRRIRHLSQHGLTDPGTRHDGALKLAWYLGVLCNAERSEVLAQVETWLRSHAHASSTLEASPEGGIRQTLREVAHYYDKRIVHCPRRSGVAAPRVLTAGLAEPDEALVARYVALEARDAVRRILRHLAAQARSGRVLEPVELSGTVLSTLCGDGRITLTNADGTRHRRRAYVVAMEELVRLGLLALHTDYSTGNHGRRYTCWYVFGSGEVPREQDDGRRVVAERAIEEGTLRVLATPAGRLEVELARAAAASSAARRGDPWWVRMYQRRAFTPLEFVEGDERKLLALPFRHRFVASTKRASSPPPGAGGPPPRGGVPPPSSAAPSSAPAVSAVVPGEIPIGEDDRSVDPWKRLRQRWMSDPDPGAWNRFKQPYRAVGAVEDPELGAIMKRVWSRWRAKHGGDDDE